MGITLPVDLLEPITEEDVDRLSAALDGTGVRFEVDEGRLILMSPVKLWHTQVSHRIRNLLEAQGRIAYLKKGNPAEQADHPRAGRSCLRDRARSGGRPA